MVRGRCPVRHPLRDRLLDLFGTQRQIMRTANGRFQRSLSLRTFLRFIAIFAGLLTIVGVGNALWADADSAFVLQIALSQDAIQPGTATWSTGAPVFFILTMKNDSRYVLHFALTSTRNKLVVLKPHETCQDTIEVSYLYELANPGEYMVQIERDMPPELGSGVVKSNVVKITVVE
jgi:hypothetical protein